MGELMMVQMMAIYVRARLGRDRSESGFLTMEALMWIVGIALVGGAIVALLFAGWLSDAKDMQRVPRTGASQ